MDINLVFFPWTTELSQCIKNSHKKIDVLGEKDQVNFVINCKVVTSPSTHWIHICHKRHIFFVKFFVCF